jgi:cyclase
MKTAVLPLAFALALGGAPRALAQADDFSKVEVKSTKVGGSVWMLEGAGGNIGVSAGPDGILLIDDQFAPLSDKIRAAVKGIDPGKIAFIVNTHWHGDHTGGNPVFGKEATIIAQDNVRKRLSIKQEFPGRVVEPLPKEGLPVITFFDAVTLWFNGEEIDVIHLPHGHTDGDSAIIFKGSNVVHMGDQFFNGMFPIVDLASGGDVVGYAKNIETMLDRIPAGAKVIPGHGALGTVDDLKKVHAMLLATTEFVRKEIAAGKTLDEAKKAGLPPEWKGWATDFVPTERWVETVYRSLKK